ncbi:hypothetical protein [Streptomyces sp. NPDC006193]|uniref:hypothetical protein n=1 Tax=Streptomyces sp. NPDC006193 TaxID=3155717 RepID=UPI0033BED0FF
MPVEAISVVVPAVTAAVLVGAALRSGRAVRGVRAAVVSPRAPEPLAHLYEVARLRGGAARLFEVAAVRMRDTGRLGMSGRHDGIRVCPAGCRAQDDVEAAFVDAAA